jgi:hypothetical protein
MKTIIEITETKKYHSFPDEKTDSYPNTTESTTNVEGVLIYTINTPTTVDKVKYKVQYFTGCWYKNRPFVVIVPNVIGMDKPFIYQTRSFKKLYELNLNK